MQKVNSSKIHCYFKHLYKQSKRRRYVVTLRNCAMIKHIEDNLLSEASEQMAKIEDTSLRQS